MGKQFAPYVSRRAPHYATGRSSLNAAAKCALQHATTGLPSPQSSTTHQGTGGQMRPPSDI